MLSHILNLLEFLENHFRYYSIRLLMQSTG